MTLRNRKLVLDFVSDKFPVSLSKMDSGSVSPCLLRPARWNLNWLTQKVASHSPWRTVIYAWSRNPLLEPSLCLSRIQIFFAKRATQSCHGHGPRKAILKSEMFKRTTFSHTVCVRNNVMAECLWLKVYALCPETIRTYQHHHTHTWQMHYIRPSAGLSSQDKGPSPCHHLASEKYHELTLFIDE